MDSTHWAAIAVAVGSIVGAIITGLRSRRKDAIGEWEAIVERQSKDIAALQAQNAQQQTAIDRMQRDHGEMQVEMSELYSYTVRIHEHYRRQAARLVKLGEPAEPTIDLPPRWQARK